MAASALESSLLKYSAKEHFFRWHIRLFLHLISNASFQGLPLSPVHRCTKCSACCCKVRPLIIISLKIVTYTWKYIKNRYEEQYPAFGDSREAKLIKVIVFAMEFVTEISQHLLWGSGPSEAADKYERMWSRHEQTLLSFSHCSPMKTNLCGPFVCKVLTKWMPWVGDLYRLLVWPWRSKMWKHSRRQSRSMIVSADLTLGMKTSLSMKGGFTCGPHLGSPPSSSAWRSRYLWRMTSARFQTMSSCCLCPLRVYKFLFYKSKQSRNRRSWLAWNLDSTNSFILLPCSLK